VWSGSSAVLLSTFLSESSGRGKIDRETVLTYKATRSLLLLSVSRLVLAPPLPPRILRPPPLPALPLARRTPSLQPTVAALRPRADPALLRQVQVSLRQVQVSHQQVVDTAALPRSREWVLQPAALRWAWDLEDPKVVPLWVVRPCSSSSRPRATRSRCTTSNSRRRGSTRTCVHPPTPWALPVWHGRRRRLLVGDSKRTTSISTGFCTTAAGCHSHAAPPLDRQVKIGAAVLTEYLISPSCSFASFSFAATTSSLLFLTDDLARPGSW
jgi:hypothetical protein